MFNETSSFYDLAKLHRDYTSKAHIIRRLLDAHCPSPAAVLEVACGTGTLLECLESYGRAGLDISPQMLSMARAKLNPNVPLYQGDFANFELSRTFGALLCLDGAIGYMSAGRLRDAFGSFARHLDSGSLLILEPWYTPEEWQPGTIHVVHNTGTQGTIVRVSYGYAGGAIDFHNVVGTAAGIHHFDERYQFFLHEYKDLVVGLRDAGFVDVRREAVPEFQRGLFVAQKP